MDIPRVQLTGVVPYINLDGAAAAAQFYSKAFDAEILVQLPAEDGKRLMHCCLKINGGHVMISDCFPEHGVTYQRSNSYTMHLQVDDIDAWFKRAVEAGAEVVMPVELMFWGDRYGQVRDPFGISWSMGMAV